MAHPGYVKEAAGHHLQPVTRPDRKDLIEFLTNAAAKPPPSIDVTAPMPVPVQLSRSALAAAHAHNAAANDKETGGEAKRPRLEVGDRRRMRRSGRGGSMNICLHFEYNTVAEREGSKKKAERTGKQLIVEY